jgi:hypothetical protein
MVIETYTKGPGPVYERAAERGRMLPPGLEYVDSWVVDDGAFSRCAGRRARGRQVGGAALTVPPNPSRSDCSTRARSCASGNASSTA